VSRLWFDAAAWTSVLVACGGGSAGPRDAGVDGAIDAGVGSISITGDVVWMESGSFRAGFSLDWGGALCAYLVDGAEIVNRHDAGRCLQVSLFDKNSSYAQGGQDGWGPSQPGDIYNQGSPVLDHEITADGLYVRVQPREWVPDKTAIPVHVDQPVPAVASDVVVEQWVTFVPDHPQALRVRWRATHTGQDVHGAINQQFPVVYANKSVDRFVSYGGAAPWTQDGLTATSFYPGGGTLASARISTTERWGAAIDADGRGIVVFSTSAPPEFVLNSFDLDAGVGPTDASTTAMQPDLMQSYGPGSIAEGEYFVIANTTGAIEARADVYALRAGWMPGVAAGPFINVESRANDTGSVGSTIDVAGWTFDDHSPVTGLSLLVDQAPAASTTTLSPRPDVQTAYPNAPLATGFHIQLDTTAYGNGKHTLQLQAALADATTILADALVTTFSNPASSPPPWTPWFRLVQGGRHFFTASPGERDAAIATGWVLEGTCCSVVSDLDASVQPIYRLRHRLDGSYRYVLSAAERDQAVSWTSDFQYEAVAGYCAPQGSAPPPGTTALYWLSKPATNDNLYTTSTSERTSALAMGYVDQGTLCYVQ
jgi:hypothetical protein